MIAKRYPHNMLELDFPYPFQILLKNDLFQAFLLIWNVGGMWLSSTLEVLFPVGLPTLFSVSGGMSHPVFCLWWDIPPCFLFAVGYPTLFSVCSGISHPVFCLWWDIPPCVLFVVGHPTLFLFAVGCPTLFSICGGKSHNVFRKYFASCRPMGLPIGRCYRSLL